MDEEQETNQDQQTCTPLSSQGTHIESNKHYHHQLQYEETFSSYPQGQKV